MIPNSSRREEKSNKKKKKEMIDVLINIRKLSEEEEEGDRNQRKDENGNEINLKRISKYNNKKMLIFLKCIYILQRKPLKFVWLMFIE